MLATSIEGDFAMIDWNGVARDDVTVCRSGRAIIVQVGPDSSAANSESSVVMPAMAIDLIEALGTTDRAHDHDGDGLVTVRDLSLLLRSDITCQ